MSAKRAEDNRHAHCQSADHCHCCPDSGWHKELALSRRGFLTTAAAGGAVLTGLSWSHLAQAGQSQVSMPPARQPLKALPILVWDHAHRAKQRSWRHWGGIQSPEEAAEEVKRIQGELDKITQQADFPVEFMDVASVKDVKEMADSPELKAADVVIVYGAGSRVNGCQNFGKDVIIFQRHRSGPLYLQYEIVSPRFLRQHTDDLAFDHITFDDVVTDSLDELTWRLRALCGLKNTKSCRIMCVGGAGGWAQPAGVIPDLVKKIWNMDLQTVPYPELGKLIEEARADKATVALAKQRAEKYLAEPNTKLETKREFVDNCFLLDQVFRQIMTEADCHAITVQGCMGTIMPKASTSACLTLSTLNDDGYLAFCESDFVVIPSGILLANISNLPVFLNDPTYPHDGVITLAHCTGPRVMNGKSRDPARIVTHFESDYGAAPKVEMPKGQLLTNIAPDFKSECWMGLLGKIVDAPFLPICRDQIDVEYEVPDQLVAERMPGFHWMTCYGDYTKEIGYALRRVGISWDNLSNIPSV
ncbi:MAG: twin-arginine translocation signal domain-containing protein [Planctomycetota bacterium]